MKIPKIPPSNNLVTIETIAIPMTTIQVSVKVCEELVERVNKVIRNQRIAAETKDPINMLRLIYLTIARRAKKITHRRPLTLQVAPSRVGSRFYE